MNYKALVFVALSTSFFTACTSTRPVYKSGYTGPVPTYYTVRRGDTVGKIARRYGLDYRYVGRLNNLDSEYTIYVNQRLKLRGKAPSSKTQAYKTPAQTWKTNRIDSTRINNPTPRPQLESASWARPSAGKVLSTYDLSQGRKGIRFSGTQGDPVLASKQGKVIYASNGLKEYGNLILVRHADGYITAYAHNDRMLVEEGASVTAGTQIATMGAQGLEFQIRKDGKAIDPMPLIAR